MSRTNQLRTNPQNNINLYDLFSTVLTNQKSKYVELFLKILRKSKRVSRYGNEIRDHFKQTFGISKENFEKFEDFQVIAMYQILDAICNFEDIRQFNKFCEFNEKGLIQQNDISRYSTFDEIASATSLAELKVESKEFEKQIVVVFQDAEWMLLRPLTYEASKKYGSNTKWCTTSNNTPDHFFKYTTEGILIYCINKITGYKVAVYYSFNDNESKFSFWNQQDSRIDSIECLLPENLKKVIYNECINENAKSNYSLLSKELRQKQEEWLERNNSEDSPRPQIAPIVERVVQADEIEHGIEIPNLTDFTRRELNQELSTTIPEQIERELDQELERELVQALERLATEESEIISNIQG